MEDLLRGLWAVLGGIFRSRPCLYVEITRCDALWGNFLEVCFRTPGTSRCGACGSQSLIFLVFLDFLPFVVARNFLVFFERFSLLSQVLGVQHREMFILAFLGGFPCFFPPKKARKPRSPHLS